MNIDPTPGISSGTKVAISIAASALFLLLIILAIVLHYLRQRSRLTSYPTKDLDGGEILRLETSSIQGIAGKDESDNVGVEIQEKAEELDVVRFGGELEGREVRRDDLI